MKRHVRLGGLASMVLACGLTGAGCGGGGVEQGVPQDLTPGVPADDPTMNPQMKPFNKSMIKSEPTPKGGAPAPAPK